MKLSGNLESCLVFLLLRFHKNAQGLYKPVALKCLNAANESGRRRSSNLRDTDDSCLILASLFPGQAGKRMVNISCFMRLGRSYYQSLADCLKKSHGELYQQLDHGFGNMLEVLKSRHGVIPVSISQQNWQQTGLNHRGHRGKEETKTLRSLM